MARDLSIDAESLMYKVQGFALLLELAIDDVLKQEDKSATEARSDGYTVLVLSPSIKTALGFAINETVMAADDLVAEWEKPS